ncbi:unnamed protein product [Musa acuminata subsp. burmannicoides]
MMDRNATGKEVVGGPPRRLRMAVTYWRGFWSGVGGGEGRGDGCVERCHSICCRRRQKMQRRGGVLSEGGKGRGDGRVKRCIARRRQAIQRVMFSLSLSLSLSSVG